MLIKALLPSVVTVQRTSPPPSTGVQAVALGLSQEHGHEPGTLSVGLSVVNDLDAAADFDSLCCEDSRTGNLLLQGHVTIRCGARQQHVVCSDWHSQMHVSLRMGPIAHVSNLVPALRGLKAMHSCGPCSHLLHAHPILACRDLLGMLQNPLDDLALEYHATTDGSTEGSLAVALPPVVSAA